MIRSVRVLSFAAAVAMVAGPVAAQFPPVTLPPSGDNQKSTVIQHIGLVKMSVDYNSPDVHSPSGEDRTGKIWGQLVPWGMSNLGFGTCGDQCPWRGGANENTVFTTSHDIKVEGQPLPAGSYGLHFIPGQEEWTVIFSKSSTSWGSYFYDAKEDALRVTVKPARSEFHEWLTYEFTDRQADKATVALKWENLQVPFKVTIDNMPELYVRNMRNELRSSPGFSWQGWQQAAQYALESQVNLDEALRWAENAAGPQSGERNFTTLTTLARLQEANGKAADAKKSMDEALNHPTANAFQIHMYARQLQNEKKNDEALKVYELNAKRHPGEWPTEFGLARGFSAVGQTAKALEHARKAVQTAPDEANRTNVENFIKQLEGAGK